MRCSRSPPISHSRPVSPARFSSVTMSASPGMLTRVVSSSLRSLSAMRAFRFSTSPLSNDQPSEPFRISAVSSIGTSMSRLSITVSVPGRRYTSKRSIWLPRL